MPKVHKYTSMQPYKYTSTQVLKYFTHIQVYKCTSKHIYVCTCILRVYKYPGSRVYDCPSIREHNYASTQAYESSNTQIDKYTSTQYKKHTLPSAASSCLSFRYAANRPWNRTALLSSSIAEYCTAELAHYCSRGSYVRFLSRIQRTLSIYNKYCTPVT